MKIRVLGSAAGGGFPQWNCNCRNCSGVRNGTLRTQARTQSSIAVCAHSERAWVLVNASPDILHQLQANPVLQPARAARDTALCAIVLVDGQIDHTTGLFMLRESTRALPIWCTDEACADLTQGNPIFGVLEHYCGVERHALRADGSPFSVAGVEGIEWRALAVSSKPAPYSPHREAPQPGDNVALVLKDRSSGRTLVYAPGSGRDGGARVARHAGGRLRAGGRHLLERRGDDHARPVEEARARHRATCRKAARAACSSGSTACPRTRAGF